MAIKESFGVSGTLADLVVERDVNPLRGLSAFYFIAAWGVYRDRKGTEPRTVDEIAEVTGLSRRKLFRWQAAFREVFPELATPATLWDLVHDQVEGEDPNVIGLQLGAARL